MKIKGFTLAEILITLGIIGVVAALTTPALVKNSGNAKVGPSLAKFVNTFETASEQLMYDEMLSTIEEKDIPLLSKEMVMTPLEIDGGYKFYNAQGTGNPKTINAYSNEFVQSLIDQMINLGMNPNHPDNIAALGAANAVLNTTLWSLKDGSVMAIIPNGSGTEDSISVGAYKGIIALVLIDIDGNKAINKAGKDVFAFLLDKTGILIPVGSNAHKSIIGKTTSTFGDLQPGKKEDEFDYVNIGTKSACDTKSTDIDTNLACTGVIADNNYKAN